jgi:uncharacterized protein (TIGR00730 family)
MRVKFMNAGNASIRYVCVYCGSSSGIRPCYLDAARQLGQVLVSERIGLVYGGAGVGLMGGIADAVLAGGGDVIGVIPESFASRVAHGGLTKLHVVDSMHERKTLMAELSDAFIALPGGFGTLEEILEILTWAQLGIHGKPCGLMNVDGYYDEFLSFLDRAVTMGFLKPVHREMLLVADSPERLLGQMAAHRVPVADKWD